MKISKLLQTNKTIFKSKEIGDILGIENSNYLKVVIKRAKERNEIQSIRKGLYVLSGNYNVYELANKIKTPSYVSLETVLQSKGVIFQDYSNTIFSVSNNSEIKKVGDKSFEYFKIKNETLGNMKGINRENSCLVASVERALCDRVYLSPGYYFDNLRGIDWNKALEIAKIYNNKRLLKELSLMSRES
jgi:hypothetical protein